MGTSILNRDVIAAAGPTIINIHGGLLPYYRGNHCIFFAMLDRRPDRVGSTIHFVDSGVDTGDVIEPVIPQFRLSEHPEVLYCRAEQMAVERLVLLLDELRQGRPLPRKPQGTGGHAYRTADRKPHHELMYWLRRRDLPHAHGCGAWRSIKMAKLTPWTTDASYIIRCNAATDEDHLQSASDLLVSLPAVLRRTRESAVLPMANWQRRSEVVLRSWPPWAQLRPLRQGGSCMSGSGNRSHCTSSRVESRWIGY